MRQYLNSWGIALIWVAVAFWAVAMPSEAQCASSGKGKVIQVVEKGADFAACKSCPVPVVVIEGTLPSSLEPGKRVILKAKGICKTTAEVLALYKNAKDAEGLQELVKDVKDKDVMVLWKEKDGDEQVVLVPSKTFMPETGTKVKLKVKRPRKVEGC